MAKKVQKWKSNDGELYDTKEEAVGADKIFKAKEGVSLVVGKHHYYDMSSDAVFDLIWDNSEEIYKALHVMHG